MRKIKQKNNRASTIVLPKFVSLSMKWCRQSQGVNRQHPAVVGIDSSPLWIVVRHGWPLWILRDTTGNRSRPWLLLISFLHLDFLLPLPVMLCAASSSTAIVAIHHCPNVISRVDNSQLLFHVNVVQMEATAGNDFRGLGVFFFLIAFREAFQGDRAHVFNLDWGEWYLTLIVNLRECRHPDCILHRILLLLVQAVGLPVCSAPRLQSITFCFYLVVPILPMSSVPFVGPCPVPIMHWLPLLFLIILSIRVLLVMSIILLTGYGCVVCVTII